MAAEQGQTNGNSRIEVRPAKTAGSAGKNISPLNHELCVIFACGQEVVVNRNTEYTLNLFQRDKNVIGWAIELMISGKRCPFFKLAR